MALTTCVDCGRDVSTEAAACPGCARPLKGRRYVTARDEILIGALLLIASLAYPALLIVLVLLALVRLVRRARRGNTTRSVLSSMVLGAACVGAVLLFGNSPGVVITFIGLAVAGLVLIAHGQWSATASLQQGDDHQYRAPR